MIGVGALRPVTGVALVVAVPAARTVSIALAADDALRDRDLAGAAQNDTHARRVQLAHPRPPREPRAADVGAGAGLCPLAEAWQCSRQPQDCPQFAQT